MRAVRAMLRGRRGPISTGRSRAIMLVCKGSASTIFARPCAHWRLPWARSAYYREAANHVADRFPRKAKPNLLRVVVGA